MISTNRTNIVVFFGDDAAEWYDNMANCWVNMLSPSSCSTTQIIVAAENPPTMDQITDEAKKRFIGNSSYYALSDPAPGTDEIRELIKSRMDSSGNATVHVIISAGEKPLDYRWIQDFCRNAAADRMHSVKLVYYMVFGTSSHKNDRQQMIDTITSTRGVTFLLGDSVASGGMVKNEARWQAVFLAVLLNCCSRIPLENKAYSLGYSALNAKGEELELMARYTAANALEEMITLDGAVGEGDFRRLIMPEGINSMSALEDELNQATRNGIHKFSGQIWENLFTTMRLDVKISAEEAAKRAKRFIDLNSSSGSDTQQNAETYAAEIYRGVMDNLTHSPLTACFPTRLIEDIIDKLRKIAEDDDISVRLSFQKLPFLKTKSALESALSQRKIDIRKAAMAYSMEKAKRVYASELTRIYEKVLSWVTGIVKTDEYENTAAGKAPYFLRVKIRELERPDTGNVKKLAQKYKEYAATLEKLHPTPEQLTKECRMELYSTSGELQELGWNKLLKRAGMNVRSAMPAEFRGTFYSVLEREFEDPSSKSKFFEEYMSSGPRMFQNYMVMGTTSQSFYFVDEEFSSQWFRGDRIDVRTGNGENLTVYPLGSNLPEEYLQEREDYDYYFAQSSTSAGGKGLFDENGEPVAKPVQEKAKSFGRGLEAEGENIVRAGRAFGRAMTRNRQPEKTAEIDSDTESTDNQDTHGIDLYPGGDGRAYLTWNWKSGHTRATVEIKQDGVRLGRVIDVPAREFTEGGYDRIDVCDRIMGGAKLPFGTGFVTVTVRGDTDGAQPYIKDAKVPVWLNCIRYRLKETAGKLLIDTTNSRLVERFLLQAMDPVDGYRVNYPLYPSTEDRPYYYTGLRIGDGELVSDPSIKQNTTVAERITEENEGE